MCSINEAWSGSVWRQVPSNNTITESSAGMLAASRQQPISDPNALLPAQSNVASSFLTEKGQQQQHEQQKLYSQLKNQTSIIHQLEYEIQQLERRLDKQMRQQQDQWLQQQQRLFLLQQQQPYWTAPYVSPALTKMNNYSDLPTNGTSTTPTTSTAWYQDWSFWIIFALLLVILVIVAVKFSSCCCTNKSQQNKPK